MRLSLPYILFLFIHPAFAKELSHSPPSVPQSEFQHQADRHVVELSNDLGLTKTSIALVPSGTIDNTALLTKPAIEYGLSSYLSLGLTAPYEWNWTNWNWTSYSSGATVVSWGDPSMFLKFRAPLAAGWVHAQLTYSRSLDYAYGDKNYSGADSLTPALGYEIPVGHGLLGAHLEYQFNLEDRKLSDYGNHDVDYRVRGGEIINLKLFYEYQARAVTYGIALGVMSRTRSTRTAVSLYAIDVTRAELLDLSHQYAAPGTDTTIEGYLPIDVMPELRLVPRLTYEAPQAFDRTTISSAHAWQVGLLARLQI